jgi:HSP20 family protein
MPSRWNPFKPLSRVDTNEFDDFFRGLGLRPLLKSMEYAPEVRIDVTESEDAFDITADVPGVRKDDLEVTVDGNQVSISAEVRRQVEPKKGEREVHSERYYGQVYRSFSLPNDVDDAQAKAQYDNGVLTLHLPKKANGSQHRIKIA